MKTSVTVRNLQFDTKGYITATFKNLRTAMLEAADAALITSAGFVPIDTGMARGSYLNLVQLLEANGYKISDTLIPRTPQSFQENGKMFTYTHTDGQVYKNQKGPQLAKKFSTTRGQIINRLGDKIAFNYEIDVSHFNIYQGWGSLNLLRQTFFTKMQSFKSPALNKFLIMSRYTYKAGDSIVRERQQKTVK